MYSDKYIFIYFSIEDLFDGGRTGWAGAGLAVFLSKSKHKGVMELVLLLLDVIKRVFDGMYLK